MSNTAMDKRVRRAAKKGVSLRDIAAKEGAPYSRIYKICNTPRFKKELLKYRQLNALKQMEAAMLIGNLRQRALLNLEKNAQEKPAEFSLTIEEMGTLTRMEMQLEEQYAKTLKAQLEQAESEEDPEITKSRTMREQRERDKKSRTLEVVPKDAQA